MIPVARVHEARERIKTLVATTPITQDPKLNIFYKWENHQVTGSFKLRGATNKIFSLHNNALVQGLVTCSAGNHGQGVAVAAANKGSRCIVYASEHASQVKVYAMKKLGADVRLVRGGYVEAERTAQQEALSTGKTFVSPYNDELVIAGQGTIGLEAVEQLAGLTEIDALLVPVGGGGLISGLGTFLSSLKVRPRIIGVQSEASSFAYHLFYTGSQQGVVEADSIAEGLAGEIDHESITIELMQKYLDDVILVSEEEIREAIRYAWHHYHEIIEGSAAVGLAARLAGKIQLHSALAIITGGNIQPELLDEIIHQNLSSDE